MQALSLCQKFCSDKIPVTPSTKLGDGADGDIYEIKDEPNKVIKFSVAYDYDSDFNNVFPNVDRCLNYLENNKPSFCATVYNHSFLCSGSRKVVNGDQKFILYYYVMEKLLKISEDEKKVFHSLLSHEDMNIVKVFTRSKVIDMLNGMSLGLDFDVVKVLNFYDNLRNSKVKHNDIHVRNIMKDRMGNFKLIDFDKMEIISDEERTIKG